MIDVRKQRGGTMQHILHVEDNVDYHTYVDTMLSDFVNVTSVYTAKELRETLSGFDFDLFIVDLVLQDASGASLAQELRNKYPDTPIVILSAHNTLVGCIDNVDAKFNKTVLEFDKFIAKIKKLLAIE